MGHRGSEGVGGTFPSRTKNARSAINLDELLCFKSKRSEKDSSSIY